MAEYEKREKTEREIFMSVCELQKKRGWHTDEIMLDFYSQMANAKNPNDTIRCFGNTFRKLRLKSAPWDSIGSIVRLTVAKFKANGWMLKECDDWDSKQAHLLIEAFKFVDKNSNDKRFGAAFLYEYLENLHLSDSVRLYGCRLYMNI